MIDEYSKPQSPSLWQAIFPILILIGILGVNVYFYGEDSSYGPNQIALLMAAAVAFCMGLTLKISTAEMLEGIKKSISSTLIAMLILLLIGSLAGTWMMSGIVPAMIYYGLDVLNPSYFLVATAIVCAIVSVVTGSSWSTVATVGIALLGIGNVLGIGIGVTAGAIISGAYFGDKISPLSDTTNLAAAMAGTDLTTHIRYMLWTTVPSFLIACAIFAAIGLAGDTNPVDSGTALLKEQIASRYNLSPFIFIVPALVLLMVFLKIDAVVALFVGAVAGAIVAIVFQPAMITKIAALDDKKVAIINDRGEEDLVETPPSYAKRSYAAFINSMAFSTQAISDEEIEALKVRKKELERLSLSLSAPTEEVRLQIDSINSELAAASLLKGKGMEGMLNTVWLILTAMCFGGIMESTGLLQRLTLPLVGLARSRGSLVATTAGSCVFTNVTASDQYLSIVLPGRMFAETYKERGLAPENLSRTLEDAGTVTSVLIPWNTCGAAQRAVLGVGVFTFAPFCFFNWISPLMTLLFAFLGIRIKKLDAE